MLEHVGVLERAGLVRRMARTSVRPVELAPGGLSEVVDWVERNREFWDASFDRLGEALARRSHVLFGVYVGVMAWAGLFLRLPALRELMPLIR